MVAIRQQLVASRANTSGSGNAHRYITVHQTGNASRGADAAAHANLQSSGNVRSASWHWTVDDTEAVQSFPHDVKCWHAGTAAGNGTSVGIEVCVNSDGNYARALANAAELVAHVMAHTGVPLSRVVQHNHWSGKNCPQQIRAAHGGIGWDRFLSMVSGAAIVTEETTGREDDDMTGFVKALYQRYLGREASAAEQVTWTLALAGKTPAEAVAAFMRSAAEPGTLPVLFGELLGRSPSDADVKAYAGLTIQQVWDNIIGSPEYAGRR